MTARASESPPPGAGAAGLPDLRTALGPLALQNPILSASGTFGYGPEVERFFDPGRLGAIVGKSITLEPREGNPPPRMAETPAGMLNSIGLQNPGLKRFCAELLPRMRAYGAPVIVNIAGKREADYAALAERLDAEPGVAALELNLSCPNVSEGGLSFSIQPAAAERLVRAVRERTRLPVFAKLTPNVTDIRVVARACEAGGAHAITAINTLLGMQIDWRRRRPVLATGAGGLSGPAIRPVAVRMVFDVSRAVGIPVIGAGGVATAEDVLEMVCAGASAVQIGTATFADPWAIPRALDALPHLLAEAGVARLADLIGSVVTSP